MAIRLNQVTKELNIGLMTIIDFLSNKGFNIEASINSKITTEQYELLRKEFSSDAVIKKIADKRKLFQTKIEDFLEYYNPIDTKEKIDDIFDQLFKLYRNQINEALLKNIYKITTDDLYTYLESVFDKYQKKVSDKSFRKKKRKKKHGKKGRKSSSSLLNKNGIEYKYRRIHIISTPM